jgi:phospholipase C
MEKREVKKITDTREVTIGFICDVCKKEHIGEDVPDNWHSFSHQHSEWGNDSMDSWEYFHVCSAGCYTTQLGKCLKEMSGYKRSAEIDNMTFDFASDLFQKLSN